MDAMSSEELKHLMNDSETWETFVTDMARDEADQLYEDLMKDKVMEENYEQFREHFLKELPSLRQQLEEYIAQLYTLADKADKVHRGCTISNVVSSSTGIVSSILTIVGLSLLPVTAGASLVLTATGLGLGAASVATSLTTTATEFMKMSSIKNKAKTMSSAGINVGDVDKGVIHDKKVSKIISKGNCLLKNLNGMMKCIQAMESIGSKLTEAAGNSCLISGGKISTQNAFRIQKVLAMTKGARIFGTVTACISLVTDVISLVQNSKDLHEGAKTESAANLRRQAQEHEKILEKLMENYKGLL